MELQYVMFEVGDAKRELIQAAIQLGALDVPSWSEAERELLSHADQPLDPSIKKLRVQIVDGADPLGDQFCVRITATERRPLGATYTPPVIVDSMLRWAADTGLPSRIIDPGCGSARFLLAAGRIFPNAELVGIDIDPMATIVARGNLSAAGFSSRSRILLADYRAMAIPRIEGRTLFIGNPPYVRHHLIEATWKKWLTDTADKLGYAASQLAGLHIHFLLSTALNASPGDLAAFITSAEWLDVNYGKLPRALFLNRLGGTGLHIIEPTAEPFPGTQATAAISTFEVGTKKSMIYFRRIAQTSELGSLNGRLSIERETLERTSRWTILTRTPTIKREGFVELGELCRVHRGQVTGANRVWIAGEHSAQLPRSVLYPAVTKARELIESRDSLDNPHCLRDVVDLPIDLDRFDSDERAAIEGFLIFARSQGADSTYIARNRKAWWSVGLKEPAPILATYMARRPPAFVVNRARVRHINVAHGIYPREYLSEVVTHRLASFLASNTDIGTGRTYSGGLTKFEPREMERILVPELKTLERQVLPGNV